MAYFEIMAECSAALAGFGAVHSVLSGWEGPRGQARAWCVVAFAGVAAGLAVLPLLFAHSSLPESTAWAIASTLGLLAAIGEAASLYIMDTRFTRLGIPPTYVIGRNSAMLTAALGGLFMAANLAGWPDGIGPFAYGLGLFFLGMTAFLPLFFSFLLPLHQALYPDPTADAAEPESAED